MREIRCRGLRMWPGLWQIQFAKLFRAELRMVICLRENLFLFENEVFCFLYTRVCSNAWLKSKCKLSSMSFLFLGCFLYSKATLLVVIIIF